MTDKAVVEVAPGFFNIRGQFKIIMGLIDIGTHMSLIRLSTGRFLVIDTVPLTDKIKTEIDTITNNGELMEAVVATHPFHTLAFPAFKKVYPNPSYYGTPRHLRNQPDIGWAGKVNDCAVLNKWAPEVQMRIPDGAEFVAPLPEKNNHFSSVLVFHAPSKTIHVDDTIMYSHNPGWLMRLAGFKHGDMAFHISIKGPGLLPHPDAPNKFRDWVQALINDWDFDNMCTAHIGNRIGGAKLVLQTCLNNAAPLFKKLTDERKGKTPAATTDDTPSMTVEGCECG